MEWIRQWRAQVQALWEGLSVSGRMVMILLTLIVAVSLGAVAYLAGRPQMVPVLDQAIDAPRRMRIESYLRTHSVPYRIEADRIMVPPEQRDYVFAVLAQEQLLPDDTSQGFSAMIESQSWWQSSEQGRQRLLIATQNELSRVLSAYPWVRSATVILSRPRDTGFGATARRPTASVNVVMQSDRLDQNKVDAIAALVSGAVAEMEPGDVTVIDAVAGRQWATRRDGDVLPTDYLEMIDAQERYYRDRLVSSLRYIDNVIVAVNVELDMTRRQVDTTRYESDGSLELLTQERRMEQRTSEPAGGGEPGVRANVGADIAGAGEAGRSSTTEESESTFEPFAGRTHELSATPGGMPTRISASVSVPRSFFVRLFRQGRGEDAAEPTDEALEPLIQERIDRIRAQVEPLLLSRDAGQLVVDVYPDDGPAPGAAEDQAVAGAGRLAQAEGYVKPIGLGALALVSLGMMLLMLRKASQRPPVPSVQELAGLPPTLGGEEDLIGEAGETDSPLQGVELDEETLRQRQLAEQVSEMVKANPGEIATLISKWVKRSD